MKRFLSALSLFIAFGLFNQASAAPYPETPYLVIQEAAQQTFKDINQYHEEIQSNVAVLRKILREDLLPYSDYKYAAFFVVGAQLKQTSRDERENFADAFKEYMIETYANALSKYYSKQTVEIIKPTTPLAKDDNFATVRVIVHQMDKSRIDIDFKLRKNNRTGQWKAFDMVVEGGVSLLTTQKSELSPMIIERGLAKVTDILVKRRQELNLKARDSSESQSKG